MDDINKHEVSSASFCCSHFSYGSDRLDAAAGLIGAKIECVELLNNTYVGARLLLILTSRWCADRRTQNYY